MAEFSVLISLYYKEKPEYLHEALDSVFKQTILPNEIVLVKDGPLTAELDAILDEYSTRYPIFKFVVNETNLGLGRALAKGIEACTYEYILRMDTDDIIPSERFAKELEALDKGYDVVSCWSILFENDINNVVAVKTRPEHHDDIVKLAHKRSPICHPGCAYRKSSVLRAGNYMHNLMYEDYDLWVRMIITGSKFYNIQEVLYYLRTSMDLVKRRGGFKYALNEMRNFLRFKELGFYTTKDVIYNSILHSFVRIVPSFLRHRILKWAWNHKSYQ
ncbi:MAG: glycosyltransferase [Alistipes sp.]|nr:glycosyltransferase [Alistipes sp.]